MNGLEVEELIYTGIISDVHEKVHAKDGVNENDQEEQEANIDQGWHGDGQSE